MGADVPANLKPNAMLPASIEEPKKGEHMAPLSYTDEGRYTIRFIAVM